MLRSRSVVVVEADPTLARLCAAELERAGATVRVVETVQEALSAVAAEMPDAILADAALPSAQCSALWESMAFFFPEARVPIVVMSDADGANPRSRSRSALLRINVRALVPAVAQAISRHHVPVEPIAYSTVTRPVGPLLQRSLTYNCQ